MTTQLIVEIAVGAVAASGGLIPIVSRIVEHCRTKRHKNNVRRIKTVYGMMNRLMVGTGSRRICVLETSNGGGVPRPGTPLYVRSLYEMNSVNTPTGRAVWTDKLTADAQLVESLVDLVDKGCWASDTEAMPDGRLRVLAEAMESPRVRLDLVKTTGTRMLILANFRSDTKPLDGHDELLVGETAMVLKSLIS